MLVPVLSIPIQQLKTLCSSGSVILILGQLKLMEGEDSETLNSLDFRFASFVEIDSALLDKPRPNLVISALIGEKFDAIDVAGRLAELGYEGAYRALSLPLPRPALIRAEVRSAAPQLDFDILIVRQDPDRLG